ncbi:MAG: PepSY domain-containing protein [Pseudonocardiaceae bacterium]
MWRQLVGKTAHRRSPFWWDNDVYYGLHFGTIVPGLHRVIWVIFGLSPVLLAVTGVTVWLTKWRSRRARHRRRTEAARSATASAGRLYHPARGDARMLGSGRGPSPDAAARRGRGAA